MSSVPVYAVVLVMGYLAQCPCLCCCIGGEILGTASLFMLLYWGWDTWHSVPVYVVVLVVGYLAQCPCLCCCIGDGILGTVSLFMLLYWW